MSMDIELNILLICFAVVCLVNIIAGCRRGMVKSVISLISLLIVSVVVLILAFGIGNYYRGRFFQVAVAVILLAVLGLVHHLLSIVFFSAKMVAKLPVVHSADKLLGVVFGILETVLILWTVYTLVMMMDLGKINVMILTWTEESRILTWLYQHNYLAFGVDRLLSEFSFIPMEELWDFLII